MMKLPTPRKKIEGRLRPENETGFPMNAKLNAIGLLILRVSFGCLMLVHGFQKVGKFSELSDKFPDPLGMGSQMSLISAIGSEVGCSILLIVGLATRFAAMPLAFTMIIACFVVHANDPWQKQELAAVYLAVYVCLIFTGGGKFSLDYCLLGKKTETLPELDSNTSA